MSEKIHAIEGDSPDDQRLGAEREASPGGHLRSDHADPEPSGQVPGQQPFWKRLAVVVGSAGGPFLALAGALPALSDQATGVPLFLSAGVGAVASVAAVEAKKGGRLVRAGSAFIVIVALLVAWAVKGNAPGPDWLAHARPLVRYQAPGPATASTLSVTGERQRGWSIEAPVGMAYEPREDRVPGLIPIYRQRCVAGCREDPVYAFSRRSTWRPEWELEEEAFRCFDPVAAPEGTQPLLRLRHPDTRARTWALPGTEHHWDALSEGFEEANDGEPLCYVWPSE